MSKNSAKQNYTQLKEWLAVYGKAKPKSQNRKIKNQSRFEDYKQKQAR